MRKYCISAILLDRNDPSRIIGRCASRFIKPSPEEREGYVPNVVYTVEPSSTGGSLVIPYGRIRLLHDLCHRAARHPS